MMYPFYHFLASTSPTSNFGFVNFQKKLWPKHKPKETNATKETPTENTKKTNLVKL